MDSYLACVLIISPSNRQRLGRQAVCNGSMDCVNSMFGAHWLPFQGLTPEETVSAEDRTSCAFANSNLCRCCSTYTNNTKVIILILEVIHVGCQLNLRERSRFGYIGFPGLVDETSRPNMIESVAASQRQGS